MAEPTAGPGPQPNPEPQPTPGGPGGRTGRRGRPWVPVVAGVVGAVLVVLVAVAVPRALREDSRDADTGTRTGTTIEGLEVWQDLRTDHTEETVDYPETPPVGGAHDPVWLACGVYDEPLRDENAVHDLEHGAIWFAYRPDLPADEVATLEAQLPGNGIMAPYPGLDSPVVVTAWERQLRLDDAGDPRIAAFVREFEGGGTAPEPSVTCEGGTADAGGAVVADT